MLHAAQGSRARSVPTSLASSRHKGAKKDDKLTDNCHKTKATRQGSPSSPNVAHNKD